MPRAIDQLFFPEIFGRHIIDQLFDVEPEQVFGEDEEDEELYRRRRPYSMGNRATINDWDDVSFFNRFRLTKTTFLMVLELIRNQLEAPNTR